jgi:hypothetical protein
LLAALEKHGLAANTVIVIASGVRGAALEEKLEELLD